MTNSVNAEGRALGQMLSAPEHVAIIGMGPSAKNYFDFAMRSGGRKKYCDEVWCINALGGVLSCDRIFHMDDVRIQEIRAAERPDSNTASMLHWMKDPDGPPIYTSRLHPDYPRLVEFPLEDVLNDLGQAYFNSTAAYAVAYAIHIGVKKIEVHGMDFTYPDAHDAEKGRGCVEFWLGVAHARGIKLAITRFTTLLDGHVPFKERFYGYDTIEPKLSNSAGRYTIEFEEKTTLPTAEEIEERYDHSRHPNALVEETDSGT